MPRIKFSAVTVRFDERPVLGPIDLDLTEERVGVIGANGCGKSTLARLINGLGEPTSGTVSVDGLSPATDGKAVRKKVGFIFSDADNQIVMPTVIDDVAFSLRRYKLSRDERRERARAALERFGLASLADQSPHLLSGGQKQLLALAAVIVTDPEVIVADEPTTLLDLRNRKMIKNVFADLDQQLVVISHDLDLVSDAERVVYLGPDPGGDPESGSRVRADGAAGPVIDRYVAEITGSMNP